MTAVRRRNSSAQASGSPTCHSRQIATFPFSDDPDPIGNDHTATATADVWRDVRCEHCGCEFVYWLSVTARGQAMSPLFLVEARAREKAADRARTGLEHQLARASRPAPCPRCGKYQRAAVRAERLRLLNKVMGKVIGWAALLAAITLLTTTSVSLAIAEVAVPAAIALLVVLLRTRTLDAPPSVVVLQRQNKTVLTRNEFEELFLAPPQVGAA